VKLITRDTDYAVRALVFIAGHKCERISVSRLVKELKIPRPFLRKILQILNKKNILTSYKGLNGGFVLGVPADKISLMSLMEIFQGPLRLNECMFKKRLCPNRSICALRAIVSGIEEKAFLKLKSTRISALLKRGD